MAAGCTGSGRIATFTFIIMLPSLLARDIQQGLHQFLVTGFEPSDEFMYGLMRRFVDDQSGWLKGPYLQVGLKTGSLGEWNQHSMILDAPST